jgi:PPIC-type PPIASE domain
MKRYKIDYRLQIVLFWCLTTSARGMLEAQIHTAAKTSAPTLHSESDVPSLPTDKPLIMIAGLCENLSAGNNSPNCKTIITQGQFEKLIEAVQPNMPLRSRREFALRYAEALVMTKKAEELGLNKGANYETQMRVARIQVLSLDAKKLIQEKASQIDDKDIESYYHNNMARFARAQVDRIYVPKNRPLSLYEKTSDSDQQSNSQYGDEATKIEVENLRTRAVAGEKFTKLQADAYQAAGIESAAPATKMTIRRTSLPPNQAVVMDLNPGAISSVLSDPNGYVFFKINNKDVLPLGQVRDEIEATLRSQRMQDELHDILDSKKPTLDESYFAQSPSSSK